VTILIIILKLSRCKHQILVIVFGLTSFSSLDSGINKTLTTSHGVEEELRGSQPGKVGVLDEASRLGAVIVFNEVRQRALTEAEGNALTLNVLLTDASDDLNKNDASLFLTCYHLDQKKILHYLNYCVTIFFIKILF